MSITHIYTVQFAHAGNSFSGSIKTAAGVRNAFSFDGTQIYDIPPAEIPPRGELHSRSLTSGLRVRTSARVWKGRVVKKHLFEMVQTDA